MMQRMGLEVVVIEGRWGDGADEAKLEEVLRKDTEKKIKAVCVVQVGLGRGARLMFALLRDGD